MTDKIGRFWLIGLLVALVGVSVYLWVSGSSIKDSSQETYLSAEASKLLGCRPYLISQGLSLDINTNGAKEYLFSCDSALTAAHRRFVWMEVYQKKVHVLLWHTEEGFKVGGCTVPGEGYSWLLDRATHQLFAIPMRGDTFAEPLEVLWNRQSNTLLLGGQLD
ncbi:MAG: hypothetical protein ABDH66_07590 [Bacteroidia bacterium]